MHIGRTGKYVYYSCKTYKNLSKNACTKHSIREDFLREIVLITINAQLSLVENVEQLIAEIEQAPTTKNALAQINKAIKSKETEIEKTNHIRDNLYIDWKSDIITREDYFRLKKKHDEKISSLRESLLTLRGQLKTIQSELTVDTPYFQYYKKFKHVDKLARSLLLELIDVIYIGENKQIEINFRFADQQKQILQLIELQQNQKTKKFAL